MDNKIIHRIQEESTAGDIFNALLNEISFSDLQSLLLEVYRRKVQSIDCKDVLKQYEKNKYVRPSHTSPQQLNAIDALTFKLVSPEFEMIELSPVAPLGCCFALGAVNQNNIVTTIRNTEVCSDMTNVLALECAERRREMLRRDKHSVDKIKLCSSQRVIRAQPYNNPNLFAHFKLFGMCTAGHDEGNMRFEEEALTDHIRIYLALVQELISMGYKFNSLRLDFVVYDRSSIDTLRRIRLVFDNQGFSIPIFFNIVEIDDQQYYASMGFHFYGTNAAGEELFLVDGGLTDWTQKLLNNKKERLMISGVGTERLINCFM
jgi:hypothetical protein